MEKTIKQKVQELININKSCEEIILELTPSGIKQATIEWYFKRLKNESTK